MNNTTCLNTQLKGESNNVNLEKFGYIKMQVVKGSASSSDRQIYFTALSTPFTIELSEGNLQAPWGTDLSNPYTITGVTRTYYLPNEDCTIYLEKYKNFNLQVIKKNLKANIADTRYSDIVAINGTGWYGKISDVNPNISNISLDGNVDVETFGVDDVKNFVNLNTLRCGANFSGGDIKELGKLTSLINLSLKRLTGTIEEFVTAQRTNGRTTCDGISCVGLHIRITPYFNLLTFNGNDLPAPSSSASTTLSWDATTITVNGTTITA